MLKASHKSPSASLAGPFYIVDLGASKVACLAARINSAHKVFVDAYFEQALPGYRANFTTNLQLAEEALLNVLQKTEDRVGRPIHKVHVTLPGPILSTRHDVVTLPVDGMVLDKHVELLQQNLGAHFAQQGETPLHSYILHYGVDSNAALENPLGLYGSELKGHYHTFTIGEQMKRSLWALMDRCHLKVDTFLASNIAASSMALSAEERASEACFIEMGASKTDVSVWRNNKCIHFKSFNIGGGALTNDVAYGGGISFDQAERIKNLYGNAVNSRRSQSEIIRVGGDKDGKEQELTRSFINTIIIERLKEILSLVKNYLSKAGVLSRMRHIVLSGGVANTVGIKELANLVFGKPVRVSFPEDLEEAANKTYNSPSLVPILGAIKYVYQPQAYCDILGENENRSIIERVKSWFKEVI